MLSTAAPTMSTTSRSSLRTTPSPTAGPRREVLEARRHRDDTSQRVHELHAVRPIRDLPDGRQGRARGLTQPVGEAVEDLGSTGEEQLVVLAATGGPGQGI